MAAVAALAGVSGQTVSRVVNDSPRVDPDTRMRVEQAMAELGYRPHRAARALRTGRSQTIGLVVTTLATVGNSRMLQATAEAAEVRGYALLLVTAGRSVAEAFVRLQDQGVDGAIVLNEASALARADDRPEGLRLVVVDAPAGDGSRAVHSDHAGGAAAATRRLLELGHESVRHLAGPENSFAAAERERGWRAALEAAGIEPLPPIRGDWTAESGFAAAVELDEASAVFCANDQMALGLIRALAENGRRVPEDVGVIGFDDVPDAANYRPPLTTIRQDFAALAVAAVDALVGEIEAAGATGATGATGAAGAAGAAADPVPDIIPTHLIERRSAARR
ncbi:MULTISPECIES: LacI family DNA-binding transcriptional regulator [unclassified Microbacterium]|uniref:LacI family DNA-binding transcriptional regulator n=1 Tax=unclassified Microbacterium TaxID=2609290 RepID=UPI000EAAB37D|nr:MULTISPECIES: LacI family DNA-binding transcriptional regulator [unclassified Microbacterium]MBT2483592.1 LacI family DNA-binding transcriptional regulator [Microbacterium sp. ISL-108]RKN69410.1 LacI family DNA-binding transcriptional regulator [Microbacterium sp. CGR2]